MGVLQSWSVNDLIIVFYVFQDYVLRLDSISYFYQWKGCFLFGKLQTIAGVGGQST